MHALIIGSELAGIILLVLVVLFGYPLYAMLKRFGVGRRFRP